MQKVFNQIYSFGEFTLDLKRGRLLHGQQEIKLRPKSFEALKYLVENNQRLISKDELIHAVWVDTAVTDDSLVKCLKDIRHALSDEAQQIIKTVHGRGYIFDQEVSDNGTIAQTTYTEETAGVQVIIEEEEASGHGDLETRGRRDAIAAPPMHSEIGYLTATIKQHRWSAVLGVLALAVSGAAAIYFTRPAEAIDSVAVMPLVNVSGDANTEYLSDGLSESIINSLSPNLKVIALNSVLRYKGKQTDPQVVGRELNVRSVLMGKLTQRGDDLLINVELVDVRDNRHLWGQQYSRKLSEINAVPAEIAQEISEKLRLRLSGDDKKRLTKRYNQSGEAYQLYMMGRYYRRRQTKEGLEKAIEYLEQAIKKDPSYAPAYAELGETYRSLTWAGLLLPKEARQKEEWAALKALQIDSALAEAHVVMANIKEMDFDWAGAEQEYKRALELDPNSVRAHETYAWHMEMLGRVDQAMPHLKRAQELDPLSLNISWDIAVLFNFLRQYDRAIEQFQKTTEMDATFPPAHRGLAETYQEKGMYEAAIAELKKANVSGAQLAYAYAVAGKSDEARKILDDLQGLAKQPGRYVSPFDFALIYMGLGEKDQAFEWLNKTYEENPYRIGFLKVNPRFDNLRSDPRFTDLLRRMKLAP